MKIKNIEIQNNIFLAPMAGVTDFAFRSIAREFGAGLSYTEMVSAKGLIMSKRKDVYKKILNTLPNEKPCAVQIFGNDAEIMAKACILPELEKFDIIDLNFGCPAPKIVRNCEGSALLKDTNRIVAIADACVKLAKKPITAKIRTGFQNDNIVCVELAKKLEEVGVSAITIHGRSKEQMFSGVVNYDLIKQVKNAVKIPVIGNGDVCDEESFNKMLETGVDAIMIGRASIGAPWIFDNFGKNITNQTKYKTIKKHLELLQTVYDEKYLTAYFRKHLLWYLKEIKNANKYRQEIVKIKTIEEAFEILKKVFQSE